MKASENSRAGDFRYFLDNKEKITSRYPAQYVLLRGQKLLAAFNSYVLAEEVARRMFQDEEYFIQHCGGA